MRSVSVLLSLLVIATSAQAQTQNRLPPATVWQVEWRNVEGYVYSAEVRLQNQGGRVEGSFNWNLVASPRSEDQGKLGMTGVEHVTGSYDSTCGILALQGARLDDPNNILGTDRYRLLVNPAGRSIAGLTATNEGNWTGQLTGVLK